VYSVGNDQATPEALAVVRLPRRPQRPPRADSRLHQHHTTHCPVAPAAATAAAPPPSRLPLFDPVTRYWPIAQERQGKGSTPRLIRGLPLSLSVPRFRPDRCTVAGADGVCHAPPPPAPLHRNPKSPGRQEAVAPGAEAGTRYRNLPAATGSVQAAAANTFLPCDGTMTATVRWTAGIPCLPVSWAPVFGFVA
jgi:hypothetical protein